jgi:hypothetical protein
LFTQILTNFQFFFGGEHEKLKIVLYGRNPGCPQPVVERLRAGNRTPWSD